VPDGPDGATDIPGHEWIQAGPNKVVGKHYNTGPFGAPQWWSSDTPDGALLYKVKGIIDTWSPDKAADYASRGYVHYHELVRVSDGAEHPTKVVWLKHIAVSHFNLDGGPHPEYYHSVTPGVDYEFIPLGFEPYPPTP
jgi:selenium-binding protein 1